MSSGIERNQNWTIVLQPPRELRDTFNLLSMLDTDLDLDRLVERVDWGGVTPQQVSYAVLGRLPQDMVYSGLAKSLFEPQAYFKALLLSAEFQGSIVPNLLGAFPEKPRRFFVHVPRSGGTSLSETLAAHTCAVPHNSIGAEWSSGHGFLQTAGAICRSVHAHDSIHVSGHYTLRSIVDGRLARFGDSIWTTIRNPRDIVLSFINYIMTILQSDPDMVRPDTRHWAGMLGLQPPLGALSADRLRQLLPRMLRHDRLLPKDMLCHFLGDGTAASSLDLLAAADVEIIDATRLDAWREQRWNVPARPWANVSGRFFAWDAIEDSERQQIDALVRQDTILHRTIVAAFGGAISVSGLDVARAGRASVAAPASAFRRIRRATRPILLDPGFTRAAPLRPSDHPGVGWADPPLHYRTIETTLQFPLIETRIRVRYARREPGRPQRSTWLRDGKAGLQQCMRRFRGRLSTLLAR